MQPVSYKAVITYKGKEGQAHFIKKVNSSSEIYYFVIISLDGDITGLRMKIDAQDRWYVADRWCPKWIYDIEPQLKAITNDPLLQNLRALS